MKENCHKTDFSVQVACFYKLVCSSTGLLQFAFSQQLLCVLQFIRTDIFSPSPFCVLWWDPWADDLERKFLKFHWEWVVIHGKTQYLVMPLESPLQVTNKFIHWSVWIHIFRCLGLGFFFPRGKNLQLFKMHVLYVMCF